MNKYDSVLEIIGHPENIKPERLLELQSDPEMMGIYNLVCMVASASDADDSVEEDIVDGEWKLFELRNFRRPAFFQRLGSRAATIAAVVFSSLAAVAIGIGISVGLTNRDSDVPSETDTITTVESDVVPHDRIADEPVMEVEPLIFENAYLKDIMEAIATHYRVEVTFKNRSSEQLRLFFILDLSLDLQEVVNQLNNFSQIEITNEGNTLIVNCR